MGGVRFPRCREFVLQNIHLVARWLDTLEKLVEHHSEDSHPEYRLFMSAEPAPSPETHIIPQGLLDNSIKITSEPPTGMRANLHGALDLFSQVPSVPPLPVPSCLLGAFWSAGTAHPLPWLHRLSTLGCPCCQGLHLESPESPSGRGSGVTRAAQGFPTQGSARLPVPFLMLNLELLQLYHEQTASAVSRALGRELLTPS